MKAFDLSGRTALVTGGNGGIGLGIAEGLARAGASVVIAARNAEKTDAAVARLARVGPSSGVRCDVADAGDVERLFATISEQHGRLDILVNNAGISEAGAPEHISEESWQRVLDVNLSAALRLSQRAFAFFRETGRGKIINIASEYALFGSPFVTAYSASKGGLVQLTRSLAVAWAQHGIQVNAIIPGWITTDMTAPVLEVKPFYDSIIQRTPAGRFGEPEELAGAAVFLASPASDFVTGVSLPVDGGYAIT